MPKTTKDRGSEDSVLVTGNSSHNDDGFDTLLEGLAFSAAASTVACLLYANKRLLLASDMSVLYQQGMLIASLKYYSFRHYTTADIFKIYAAKYRDRPFLQLDNEIWTYDEVERVSNQIARWYRSLKIGRNQSIALILENCPEYFVFWIAAHKLGICCALINYHQTRVPLLHSMHISRAHIIISDEKNYAKIMSCYDNDPPVPVYILRESLHPTAQQLYRERNRTVNLSDVNANSDTNKNKNTFRLLDTTITSGTRDSESSVDDAHGVQKDSQVPTSMNDESNMQLPSSNTIVKTINNELFLYDFSDEPTPREWCCGTGFHDPGLLVYTSGTTGLPKAANIPHSRIFGGGYLFGSRFGVKNNDRLYNVLPFYHSSGGMLGFSLILCVGGCMIIRKRFSASSFWHDCTLYKATVILYIGELCRYLLHTPKQQYIENYHSVRLAIGNGLGSDIWKEFQSRFKIQKIGEFYSSTEGNLGLFNLCTKVSEQGAVGKMGVVVEWLSNMRLIRIDPNTLEPIRQRTKYDTGDTNTGYCIQCKDGEPGELICKIITWDPIRRFSGYYNNNECTQKKILMNVFSKKDQYFRSGDLLRKDPNNNGYWYFVDRIGDTFRWKGENVSTTEIQLILSQFKDGIKEYTIYGSTIPNHEGRACTMAAAIDPTVFSFSNFTTFVQQHLPSYCIPLFIRVVQSLDTTSTFKVKRNQLRDDGVNPDTVHDPLYVYIQNTYVPLTQDLWYRIINSICKL